MTSVRVQLLDQSHRIVLKRCPEEEVLGELLRVVPVTPCARAESDRVDVVILAVEGEPPGEGKRMLEMLERFVAGEGRQGATRAEVDDRESGSHGECPRQPLVVVADLALQVEFG
jgi:hypothetical protein